MSDICRLQTFQLNITFLFPFPKANRKQANLSAIQANLTEIQAIKPERYLVLNVVCSLQMSVWPWARDSDIFITCFRSALGEECFEECHFRC